MRERCSRFITIASLIVILGYGNLAAAPGDVDLGFGVGGKLVMPVAGWLVATNTRIQPDGRFVTIGFDDGPSEPFAFRHNSNGVVDPMFIFNSQYAYYYDFVVLSDMKILGVTTEGLSSGGVSHIVFGLHRFNENGTRDMTFGTNGVVKTLIANHSVPQRVVIQPDGKIVVAGMATENAAPSPITNYKIAIARYHPNGVIDDTYGANGVVVSDAGICLPYLQADSKLLCRNNRIISRFDTEGRLDNGFGTDGRLNVGRDSGATAVQSDGKILAGVDGPVTTIKRYMPNGSVDQTFGANGSVNTTHPARALAVQGNGKILTSGEANGNLMISSLGQNGTVDASFGTNGSVMMSFQSSSGIRVSELILQPDNKIVVTGEVELGSYYTSSPFIARFLNPGIETSVGVSGRVLSPSGQGLRNATVRLIDPQGTVRSTVTSSFGIYSFTYLVPGQEYTITVGSKRYRFASRTLSPNINVNGFDLVGLE